MGCELAPATAAGLAIRGKADRASSQPPTSTNYTYTCLPPMLYLGDHDNRATTGDNGDDLVGLGDSQFATRLHTAPRALGSRLVSKG